MRRTNISMYHEYRRGADGRRRKFYCVQWPKPGQGRHRQFFKDYQEARRFRDQKLREREKYGAEHLAFTDKQRVEYADAVEVLKPFGRSLLEAARYFVDHLKASERNKRSVSAVELVEEIIAAKNADGMSKRYVRDLRSRLPRFAKDFNGKLVSEIRTEEIDDWLRGLAVGPTTRNNFHRALKMMFAYAVKHSYSDSNPAAGTEKAKEINAPPGILTVQQTARLLEAASPELLPYVAIGVFGGLRRAELERLDWSEIHFDENLIEVTAEKSKTARRRFVKHASGSGYNHSAAKMAK